jgi:hypothetical protein
VVTTSDRDEAGRGGAEVEEEAPGVTVNRIRGDGGEDARREDALALVHCNHIIRACQHNTSPRILASIRKS